MSKGAVDMAQARLLAVAIHAARHPGCAHGYHQLDLDSAVHKIRKERKRENDPAYWKSLWQSGEDELAALRAELAECQGEQQRERAG